MDWIIDQIYLSLDELFIEHTIGSYNNVIGNFYRVKLIKFEDLFIN